MKTSGSSRPALLAIADKLKGKNLFLNTSTLMEFSMHPRSWPNPHKEEFNKGAFEIEEDEYD